jgi:hypothetical protein
VISAVAAHVLFAVVSVGAPAAQLAADQEREVDAAIAFFRDGGLHSIQLPTKDRASLTSILVLAAAGTKQKSFTLGAFQFDTPPKDYQVVMKIFSVLRDPTTRRAFAERFADGIDKGVLQARWVTMAPPGEKDEIPMSVTSPLKAPESRQILTSPLLK